jgi:phage shock protein PspC (stress-responsive transcriptional regulator)
MKGNVLDYSMANATGVITAEDGNRYRFEGREWLSAARQPTAGVPVDFVAGEPGVATQVYVDPMAGGRGSAWGTSSASLQALGLDERYAGLYRSSDEGMILGFAAGLAHKFNAPVGVIRIFWLVSLLFVFGFFLYFVGIFFPQVPTRGVPHPQ